MRQQARVFCPPQTPDNFLSVYMAGSLAIVELPRWAMQLWFDYGIFLFASNDNLLVSNDNRRAYGL